MPFHSHQTGKNVKNWQCQVSEDEERWDPASTSGGRGVGGIKWYDRWRFCTVRDRPPLPQRNSCTCAAGDTHRMSDASLFVAVQPLKRKSWAAASQSLSAPKPLSAPQSGRQRLLSGVLSKQDTPFTLECLVFPFYKTGKPTFFPSLS